MQEQLLAYRNKLMARANDASAAPSERASARRIAGLIHKNRPTVRLRVKASGSPGLLLVDVSLPGDHQHRTQVEPGSNFFGWSYDQLKAMAGRGWVRSDEQ
jgi:hypothetical protein